MDQFKPANRMRRKSSSARLPKANFEADSAEAFDPSPNADTASLFSVKSGGPGTSLYSASSSTINLPTPSLPSQSAGVALENLRNNVARRIDTWGVLRRAHSGSTYWMESVRFTKDDLYTIFDHNRMRVRTTRFAVLGMSLSSLLENTVAQDFLRGLRSLADEFDNVQDDKFDRSKSKSLSRAAGRGKRVGTAGGDDSGDSSHIVHPNIPFELDYFQVILTLCDMLEETYQKIQSYLGPPTTSAGGFPQPPGSAPSGALGDKGAGLNPQLVEAATKADAKFKKLSTMIVKEFDAAAREMLKKELSALTGGADWGLDVLGEGL